MMTAKSRAADKKSDCKQLLVAELRILYFGINSLTDSPSGDGSRSCEIIIRIVRGIADRHNIGLSSMGEQVSDRLCNRQRMLKAVDNISKVLRFLKAHKTIKMIDEGEINNLSNEILILLGRDNTHQSPPCSK